MKSGDRPIMPQVVRAKWSIMTRGFSRASRVLAQPVEELPSRPRWHRASLLSRRLPAQSTACPGERPVVRAPRPARPELEGKSSLAGKKAELAAEFGN